MKTALSSIYKMLCIFLILSPLHFVLAKDFANQGELDDLFAIENIVQKPKEAYDPFEEINRKVFELNVKIVKTTREKRKKGLFGYRPAKRNKKPSAFLTAVKTGMFNFLDNLSETSNFVNAAIQGRPQECFNAAWRFIINSSVGFLGFVDVAQSFDLKRQRISFEQTLMKYGAGPGPYIVMPVIGTYSLRRVAADILEVLVNPLFFLIDNKFVVFAIYDYNVVSRYFDYYNLVFQDNVDSYAKLRAFYLQNPIF